MAERVGVAVIGGGFYGARLALALAPRSPDGVLLIERGKGLMRRASFVNQARVHNGYHYPRARMTALAARRNSRRFIEEHRFAVRREVPMLYAIARQSRVSAAQFARFCAEIEAPCRPAAAPHARLFDGTAVEAAFEVREHAFDAAAIARDLAARLAAAGIACRFGETARVADADAHGVRLRLGGEVIQARHVLNCTYADLDGLGVPLRTRLRKELAEIVLIRPPPALAGLAVTVMDGPFFSAMPFPALGCHSLTHVRYTPHCAWSGSAPPPRPGPSRAAPMLRDAARFLPAMEAAQEIRSLYEVKVVLDAAEESDARPVLLEQSAESARVLSVLGSKIDHVYELEALLAARDFAW